MGSFPETYNERVLSLYSISLHDFLKRKLADCFLKKKLIGAICGVKGSSTLQVEIIRTYNRKTF